MKYFSVFSGVAGFEEGIIQACESMGMESECVGYSEINPYAISIYQKHFPNHKNYGDISKIDYKEVPNFHMLVGGSPCQAWSAAGKHGGFEDSRGTLWYEYFRCLKEKQPKIFVAENVKGILSHDKGDSFIKICEAFSELGYVIDFDILNSKYFGVPQNRERVFIIGLRKDFYEQQAKEYSRKAESQDDTESSYKNGCSTFPKTYEEYCESYRSSRGECGGEVLCISEGGRKNTEEVSSTCIDANYWKGPDNHGQRTMIIESKDLHELTRGLADAERVYDSSGIAGTLKAGAKTGLYAVPLKFLGRNQKNYQGEYSFTVYTVNSGGILKDNRIRRLTPLECERLQGFKDNWTQYDYEGKVVSDTRRYQACGNSVTVAVIKSIMETLINSLI